MANTTGKKYGGRSKGTPNKTTAEIREKYKMLISESIDTLKDDIDQLEPKDRIKAILELSKFVLPTLKATDLKIDNSDENFKPVTIMFKNYKNENKQL